MYKLIAGQATAAGGSEEQDLRLKAIMSQLKSTKDDKEKLENDLFSAQQEKERLEEQVKNLEKERQEAQTELRGDRPKLVAVAGVVQQQEREKPAPRKQQQPQAHIQPHLRTAHTRDEHWTNKTQAASICPMAQRATSQAVVLPTSQMSSGQPEVATIQPTVSVSPSVSSATGSSATLSKQVLLSESEESSKKARKKSDGENMELQEATNKTNTSNSQIEEDVVVEEGSEDNVESEQGNLGTGEQDNIQKSGAQKRKASERRDNLLISQQKQQEMLLTTIGCGLSHMIEDEDTPARMLGSLKALKHYTTFSSGSEDKDAPPKKKRKKLQKIPKVEKQDQEYFEYDEIKMEPVEHDKSAQAPEQQNDDGK